MNIYNEISKLKTESNSTDKAFCQAEEHLRKGQTQDFLDTVMKCSISVSKQLVILRNIYTSMQRNPDERAEFEKQISVALNISVKRLKGTSNGIVITVPSLLPNQRTSAKYYKDSVCVSVFRALLEFCEENDFEPIVNSAIIINSCINNASLRYLSDNDNKEAKDLINVLRQIVIKNDSGFLCDIMFTSRKTGGDNRTEIYVCSKDELPKIYENLF